MKYSFIIPTYNSRRWIESSLNSLLAQTYTGFEIIVLDSGSTDDTIAWIRSLNDKRVRIYTTETRLNIAENWGRITSVTKNEFMTIMGHDDVLYPDYLATIDELITEFPDAALYQTHFNFIDGKGELIRACKPIKKILQPAELLERVLTNTIEITATGFMMRSKDYDALGGIPPYPNLLYADTALWLKLILDSYLVVSPQYCFAFRFHVDNTSKSAGKSRLVAFEKKIDFFVQLKDRAIIFKSLIEQHGLAFLKNSVVGSCHKLLYFSTANRGGVAMHDIIASAKICAEKLLPGSNFLPEKYPGIKLAKWIDSNIVTRSLFQFYKRSKKRTF